MMCLSPMTRIKEDQYGVFFSLCDFLEHNLKALLSCNVNCIRFFKTCFLCNVGCLPFLKHDFYVLWVAYVFLQH